MPMTTIVLGVLLVLLSVIFAGITQTTSITVFIPAIFGVLFLVLGVVAFQAKARMHAIHGALLLALLAIVGSAMRVPTWFSQEGPSFYAILAQLLTLVLCIGYIVMGVRSFIAARKARKAEPTSES